MIFRYPGGKSKKSIQEKILKYFPKEYEEFRDCMVGGGGIFFAVPKSKKRWINDLNPDLMLVYSALKDRPEEFISACREIAPQKDGEELAPARDGKPLYNARLKEHFDFFKNNTECDQALRYFFVNRTVFAGRVNYEMESRLYFSNPQGWNIVNTDKLEKVAEYVKNVKITAGDYTEPLFTWSPWETLCYLDPPYYKNTELSARSQLYRHNFTKEDHINLSENVRKCKHKVIISYDDHEFIRNLYCTADGFRLHSENWTYSGTSLKKKEIGKELVITNYEL